MKGVYMDRVIEVGHEGDPPLRVRPHPDDPKSSLSLCTESSQEVEHWGQLNLWLPLDLARALGKALIEAADQLEQQR
jgi:hypothetical protein